jgi:SAM-dependent methyltransferase
LSRTDDDVKAQYEALPYPARDPRDETKRLIIGSPSQLAEIEHYIFAGRWPRDRTVRALFAGGGTGDGLIMLAEQLRATGRTAELVYLDQSVAARAIAEARARARKLEGIRFVTASLFDLPSLDLGLFDYIDCCGVLHHLDSAETGLAALAGALSEFGGIGLLVYGRIGRTGVYEAQDVLRRIASDGAMAERAKIARKLVGQLPATNWLLRNTAIRDYREGGDAGVADLLLHARDRAFGADELFALADGAGLRLVTLIEPARYDPASYLSDPMLKARCAELDPPARAAVAERLCGNIKSHICYLTRVGNPVAPPEPDAPDIVPVLHGIDGESLARAIGTRAVVVAEVEGLELRFAVPRTAAAIVRWIDGKRSLAEIETEIAGVMPGLREKAFFHDFVELYRVLNGLNRLLLRVA